MHLFYQVESVVQNKRETIQKLQKRASVLHKLKMIILSSVIVAILLPSTIYTVSSMSEDVRHKPQSVTYVVGDGETLWGIASRHAPAKMDIRDYIDDIRKINQLDSSMLRGGQRLELP